VAQPNDIWHMVRQRAFLVCPQTASLLPSFPSLSSPLPSHLFLLPPPSSLPLLEEGKRGNLLDGRHGLSGLLPGKVEGAVDDVDFVVGKRGALEGSPAAVNIHQRLQLVPPEQSLRPSSAALRLLQKGKSPERLLALKMKTLKSMKTMRPIPRNDGLQA
jgi:hypothetical protein